ncbi:MAG: sulfite exporter TauE/SafE family protein [Eubacteriales bacterium]|nr:sulfite exporter TauE/SafE family protein [Eubacteriales bacterium]
MISFVVGAVTGVLSGFGIGGGSLLILWLTMMEHVAQYTAAGINLLYFLCCAPAALVSHIRHHLVDKQVTLWCTIAGCITSPLASLAAGAIPMDWLRRFFGILLLILGIKELFAKKSK